MFIKTMDLADLNAKSILDEYKSNALSEEMDQISGIIEYPGPFSGYKKLKDVSVIHRKCITAKAKDITRNGFTIKATSETPNEGNKERINKVFSNWETIEALYRMMEDKESYEFCCAEIIRDVAGNFVGLKHLRANTVRMCSKGEKVVQRVGTKTRYYRVVGKRSEELNCQTGHWETEMLSEIPEADIATDILWINGNGPDSDYYGEPEYRAATITILSDWKLREYNYNTFRTNRVPNYFITITGNFENEDEEEDGTFESDLEKEISAVSNEPGSAIVCAINAGDANSRIDVQVTKLSEETKEGSFENLRASNEQEILEAHEVPPQRVGVNPTGSLGGNLSTEINRQYNDKVIIPKQMELANIINSVLIKEDMEITDYVIEFLSLNTQDINADFEMAKAMVLNGTMKPIEFRNKFADKMDIITTPNDKFLYPELDQFYFNGKPLVPSEATDALDILKSFEGKVQEVIKK